MIRTEGDARKSLFEFAATIQGWQWRTAPTTNPLFGHVLSKHAWCKSLALESWESLRIKWRSQITDELNTKGVRLEAWRRLVQEARVAIDDAMLCAAGGKLPGNVGDSLRWDLGMAWQATILSLESPYVRLLDLYATGWLPGGSVGGSRVEDLGLIEAHKIVCD